MKTDIVDYLRGRIEDSNDFYNTHHHLVKDACEKFGAAPVEVLEIYEQLQEDLKIMQEPHRPQHHSAPNEVVIVDEAWHEIRLFRKELELRNVHVRQFHTADDCLAFVCRKPKVDLFVLDVMLISHTAYSSAETQTHLLTGLILARDIRKKYRATPIIFFTNHNSPHYIAEIQHTAEIIGNTVLLQKFKLNSPYDFAEVIEDVLINGFQGKGRSLFTVIVEALSVQIGPVALDVGKLKAGLKERK